MIDENHSAAHDFVTCVSWVQRGVAKRQPTQIQYESEELRQVISRTRQNLLDHGEMQENLDQAMADVDMGVEDHQTDGTQLNSNRNQEDDDDIVRRYGLDTYDDESDEEATNVIGGMGNLVQHENNQQDPYLEPNPEDSESEAEDFMIQDNDNLLLVGHVQEDASSLDVYVYNDEDNYVHHDVILPAFPMCFEPIYYDSVQQCTANFLAIGDMTKYIQIWDLDVVNELEPKITLKGHKDAVLGLSWNSQAKNILASCSVDKSVRIWDLNVNKSIHQLKKFADRIQSLEFNPNEAEKLLVGDCSGRITLVDCNSFDQRHFNISNCEIEKVSWNPFSPNSFVASTDKGAIYTFDCRTAGPVHHIQAHEDSVTDLAFSKKCSNLLLSAGADSQIKIWDLERNRLKLVHTYDQANVGKIYALSANPDLPFVFAAGGDNKQKNLEVLDISNIETVTNHFSSRL